MDTVFNILQAMAREMVAPTTAAVAIAVIGLNVHFGFTGLLNMGQAGFMLLGAYGFAISIRNGLSLPLGVLIGFGAALVFALILGIPTLKLRGDYLAIVTISAAEIIRFSGRLSILTDFTGAAQGIPGSEYRDPFTNLSFFGAGSTDIGFLDYANTGVNGWWVRFVAWTLVAICAFVVYLLTRSPWGASCAVSGKTRTRSAASARTSSRSRCRRWSSAACWERSGGWCTSCPAPSRPTPSGVR